MIRLPAERAAALATEHGTPCYAYDLPVVREQYRALRSSLPPWCDVFYAIKANPFPDVVRCLLAEGSGLEVASRGELDLARSLDAPARRIAYAGPGKRDEELRAALEAGLVLHVESAGELARAERIAAELGVKRDVSVRVNPPWGVDEQVVILGGRQPTQFGVDLDELPAFVEAASRGTRLRLAGLHVFAATNVLDAGALVENADRVLELAARLAREGVAMETVDVGGGLGIPYRPDQRPLDLARLGSGIESARRARFGADGPRVILEPGRFLVGEAGTFLSRVIDRKRCRGREFVVCDAGINALMRPALIGQRHPMEVVGSEGRGALGSFEVVGPLCTSLDVLGHDVPLVDPRPGDLIAVGCAGAYGFTEAMTLFLSHPPPSQVALDG